jgi:hypothetical protein
MRIGTTLVAKYGAKSQRQKARGTLISFQTHKLFNGRFEKMALNGVAETARAADV